MLFPPKKPSSKLKHIKMGISIKIHKLINKKYFAALVFVCSTPIVCPIAKLPHSTAIMISPTATEEDIRSSC